MAKEASTLIRLPDVDEFVPSHSASGSKAYLHLNTDKASGSGIYRPNRIHYGDSRYRSYGVKIRRQHNGLYRRNSSGVQRIT